MISFKPEWAKFMDGEHVIEKQVEEATASLLMTGAGYGAGRGIDYALAAACEDADTPNEALDHLHFIIRQLEIARDNMRKDIPEGDA